MTKEKVKQAAKQAGKWASLPMWGPFWMLKEIYQGLFCVRKNGNNIKEFSSKKFFAVIITFLAIANHLHLHLFPESHWVTILTKAKVHYSVIIALIASLDALAGWSLKVYAKAKTDGAA